MAEEEQKQEEEEEGEEVELPDLTKLLGNLDDLVRQGELSRERASFARQKIEDLHAAISKSKAVRRKLTNDSLDLSLRLETEIESLKKEMQLQSEDEITLDLLCEDSETAENEALLCREKEQVLMSEEADLHKAQEDFQKRIKEIEEEHAAALAPQMLQLKLDTEAVKRQIQEGTSKIEQCRKEIEETKGKLAQLLSDIDHVQIQKKNDFELLSSFDGVPEKLRKQADALLSSVKGLHVQEQRQSDKIKEMESELVNLQNTKKSLAENHAQSCSEFEKFRHLIEQKEVSVNDLKKELEMATLEADQYLADRVNCEMQLKSAQLDQKHEQELLAQHNKEKDRVLRKLQQVDNQLRTIQESLPLITAEKEKSHHQAVLSENEKKKSSVCVEEMKKEFDLQMRNYLGIESVSKDVLMKLRKGYKEVERLESEVLGAIQVEYASHQQMGELASLREHTCRLLSSKETIDEKVTEGARMNGFISTAEKEMSLFRKHYEGCVLDRNAVGISLIDRNDELCILYEKSNVQEELYRISDIEMSKRENEISFLKHRVGSLERSILICYTSVPKARELRNTIKDLKHELKRVTAESDKLSDLVEKPQNTARWKLLHGMDPSDTQLRTKLAYIEGSLSRREDESLEKELILEEISELAEDVKRQAAKNLKESKDTASRISEYQHNIRAVTHQMMALVSEISLAQATATSLQKEKEALSQLVEDAYSCLYVDEVR